MRKIFYIRWYKFDKPVWGTLKGSSKYYLTIKFFDKWYLDFRIMTQDGSFSFRNDQLHNYLLQLKQRNLKF